MTIHRVKHDTIPVSAFKPEAVKGNRSKILRWFQNEHLKQPDCPLRVEDERDGKFVLWTLHVSVPLNIPEGGAGVIGIGSESLAQTTVDKIEAAPVSNLTHGCDFVIFEDSPISRESCQHKGQ
jgi:hypothetical protein